MSSNIRNICPSCVIDERRKFQEDMPIIEIGDYVKTTFKRADGATEHMWIEVKNIGNETFTGALANDPIIVNMKEDDIVTVLKSEVWAHLKAE